MIHTGKVSYLQYNALLQCLAHSQHTRMQTKYTESIMQMKYNVPILVTHTSLLSMVLPKLHSDQTVTAGLTNTGVQTTSKQAQSLSSPKGVG